MTAEQAAISRAEMGVSEHAMTGAWRVIIARKPNGQARTWYFHANDNPRWKAALHRSASDWMEG